MYKFLIPITLLGIAVVLMRSQDPHEWNPSPSGSFPPVPLDYYMLEEPLKADFDTVQNFFEKDRNESGNTKCSASGYQFADQNSLRMHRFHLDLLAHTYAHALYTPRVAHACP